MSSRGIGAVVYKVPELENDRLLKISLRSIENEDTTQISQVLNIFTTQSTSPVELRKCVARVKS